MSPLPVQMRCQDQSSRLAARFPHRASTWRLRTRSLQLPTLPRIMGILNVTPDSFSDGGRHLDYPLAIDSALQMAADGADIIDVGGESTRPYSNPVSAREELNRVIPVVQALCEKLTLPISIDTSKAAVAREAIAAGAQIVNDVTALAADPGMIPLALETRVAVCAMHMQGTPQTMQDNPSYHDVVEDVFAWLRERRDTLLAAGIAQDQLCLDPGIGFGKTHQHNLDLLANCWRLLDLGCPVLVGHSRKGFMAKFLADKADDRTTATLGVSLSLASQGIQILRVHDVRPVREALLLYWATGGIDGQAAQIDS